MSRLFVSKIVAAIVAIFFTLRNSFAINEELYNSSNSLHVALSPIRYKNFPSIESFYGNPNLSLESSIDWSNIVFMIHIYNSYDADRIFKIHFNTWLKHVGRGADVLYITDYDDDRPVYEIFPPEVNNIEATCHLHRSPARKDGNHLRFKVIDGFIYALEKKYTFEKKYFLKMDSDNYFNAERLLAYLNNLHIETYPKPVHFGRANCFPICYTEGGLYGFNHVGFTALVEYFKDYPGITTFQHFNFPDKVMNKTMLHEDYMVSYVYREATQTPMIHAPLILKIKRFNEQTTRKEFSEFLTWRHDGISFHPFKYPILFYECENFFYFPNGTFRREAW